MSIRKLPLALSIGAGLLVAPLAWIVNMQLGEILPYLDCQHQARYSAIASFGFAVAAGLAGALSWRSVSRARKYEPTLTLAFLGSVAALSAVIFVFALSMQGIASLVLSGCER
jgi:hypothetical protein